MEAIINVGLSGSGKTYNNRLYPNHKVISKDNYRKTLVNYDPNKNFWLSYPYYDMNIETNILDIMNKEIIKCSEKSENIIIDNTNLVPFKTFKLKEFLRSLGYSIKVNNYNTTDDINYYLTNNKKRLDCIDSSIINDQYIIACISELIPLESKNILVVDIEGTVLFQTNREDRNITHANEYIISLIKHLYQTNYCDHIQFISNQKSTSYCLIIDWLLTHGFDMKVHKLLCRKSNDNRPETVVKSEIYNNCFKHHNILTLLEDNPEIFSMYENIGLPVLQVSS